MNMCTYFNEILIYMIPWAVIKQNKNILMYLLDLMLLDVQH